MLKKVDIVKVLLVFAILVMGPIAAALHVKKIDMVAEGMGLVTHNVTVTDYDKDGTIKNVYSYDY